MNLLQENKVFQRPCRSVLLPLYCFAITIVNSYDRSIFNIGPRRLLQLAARVGRQTHVVQKNPRVRKIRVRNSGAGNGCANFMDTWKNAVLSAGKAMSVKFLVFRGGFGGGGGGEVPILFLWARGFF